MAKKLNDDGKKSNGPTPQEYLTFRTDYRELEREQEELNGRRRLLTKRAKNMGLSTAAVSIVRKFAKMEEDEAEVLARTVVTYATWEELTAWSQASLFGDPIDTAPAEAVELWSMEMVFDAGVKAHGENIAVEECPFDVWSSNGAKWLEGWRASEARARASQEEGVTKPAAVRGGRRKVQPLDVSDVPRKGGVH